MSSTVSVPHTLGSSRLRSLVWPREHGAWGILLIPLVTGAWLGRPTTATITPVLLFALAALGLFCLRTPVEAWLRISPLRARNVTEQRAILAAILIYLALSGGALGVLILKERAYGLLLLGAAAAAAFFVQAVLKTLGRQTRMNAQWTGAIALTSTAAGAYYLASGSFGRMALIVWAVNWLFAANQIHYVQLRIHSAHLNTPAERFSQAQGYLLGEVLTGLLLGAAWRAGWLPGLCLLAFAPALCRGVAWIFQRPQRLEIHRLGMSELAQALVFGIVLIAAFQIHGG
jgi:hypothetical protein